MDAQFQSNRVKYNKSNYRNVFGDLPHALEQLEASEDEPSLCQCVERWLERTPGLAKQGFDFPSKFKEVVDSIFSREMEKIDQESNETMKKHLLTNLKFVSYYT